ncbi:MAG: TonB-dependent receptor [Mangrovibacterium sp.]
MKLTLLILFIAVMETWAVESYAQTTRLTLKMENASIEEVLKKIEDRSEFRFFYNGIINVDQLVSVDFKDRTVADVLKDIFDGTYIQYKVMGRQIMLSETESASEWATQQPRAISGKVTDSSGAPLPGVTVVIKNTTSGAITGADGSYTLANVPADATLVFSFIGMKTQEVIVDGKTNVNIKMQEEAISLDEVVAVGYGTQKKVNLTGAVSTVSGDKLARRAVANPTTLLQGMFPGVSITQNTGLPGFDGSSIQIRGLGSYGADTAPLVLVDGVPGDMSLLNPRSIESVTVLKDAASAAVYGSRAGNGVILVTTKDGSNSPDGKLSVSYHVNYGIHNPVNLVDMVSSSPDYMRWYNLYKRNSNYGDDPAYKYSEADIAAYTNPSDPVLYPSYDWGADIKATPTVMHDVSISGGKQTHYNLVLGYTDQKGAIEFFHAKKYTGQFNITSEISKNLKAGANIGLFYNSSGTAEGSGDYGYFLAQPPTYMPFLPDGSGRYTWRAFVFEEHPWNPYALGENYLFYRKNADISAQLWFDLKLVEGLHWYTKGSVNYGTVNNRNFVGKNLKLYLYRDPENSSGSYELGNRLSEEYTQTVYRNVYSYANYEKLFGNVHHINAMIGYNWETKYFQDFYGRRTGYLTYSTPTLDAGSTSGQSMYGSNSTWGIISGFGRFNYDYAGKYLFEASARYDGTSRMASGNRWGLFPSFSVGWRFSEEHFMGALKPWLSNAKLRITWGKLGNQDIGIYPYQAMLNFVDSYSFDNSVLSQAIAQTTLNNRNITWEVTRTTNLGLDLTLFNKLSLSVDVYKRLTTDILRSAQGTAVLGLSTPTINDGEMQNKGIDLSMDYQDKVKSGPLKNFTYSIGVVASAFKNKTVKFGTMEDGGRYLIREGSPWKEWYLLKAIGIFQSQEEINNSPKQYGENTQPGSLKFEDVKKDGVINDEDRVPMGYGAFPDFSYGITCSAGWKNFDVYCSFTGLKGQTDYSTSGYMKNPSIVPTKYQYKHAWTSENHSTKMVAPGNPLATKHPSTYFLFEKSFLRLKALEFGYTLPTNFLNKYGVSKFRIYFAGDNLLTFTKYIGMDPEGATGDFPLDKVVSFGCNVNF